MWSLLPSGSFVEFELTFLIQKHHVWNVFGTPVQPPWSLTQDRGLWVARNTFLWVLLTHRNFTEDLGTLRKSLWTIQRSCQRLGLCPSLSLLFYEFMYKYKAKPLLNIIIFHLYIALRLRINLNIVCSDSHHWNYTSTSSVLFITSIFRLDSFTLSWTKILSWIVSHTLEIFFKCN
jgi:hypothetical protein